MSEWQSDDEMDAVYDAIDEQPTHAPTDADAGGGDMETCAVCKAKQSGTKAPKRKCSCSSGLTAQRDRACDRAKEREQRSSVDFETPCRDGLHDLLPAKLFSARSSHFFSSIHAGPDSWCYDCAKRRHQHSQACWDEFLAVHTDWGRFADRLHQHVDPLRRWNGNLTEDLTELRTLLTSNEFARFSRDHARSLHLELSSHFSAVCEFGPLEAARLFVDCAGMKVIDRLVYTHDDDIATAAQPLYLAAAGGSVDIVRWLLELGADPNVPAGDGTTPFYIACENAGLDGSDRCMAVLQLLRDHGADMTAADQDGTTPALIAAAMGHCDVIRLLHESGVDLRAPGHIYSEEWTVLKRNVTPLAIARDNEHEDVIVYLQTVLTPQAEKRARSDEPMLARAQKVGVAHRLKPIPDRLLAAVRDGLGTDEEIKAAKKQLKALQTANQQIVSRAEKAHLKQTKIA